MSDTEGRSSTKKGLQGWKAFFVVFASGMTAAFLVFGILVGIVTALGSALTGSPKSGADGGGVAPARGSVDSMKVGALDLCRALEQEGLKGDLPERQDSGKDYVDTGASKSTKKSEQRTVSDSCRWKVEPEYRKIWNVELVYKAYASGGAESSSMPLADDYFRSSAASIEDDFTEKIESGKLDGFGEESRYVFGEGDSGKRQLSALGREKTGVLLLKLTEENPSELDDQSLNNEFKGKSKAVAPRMFERFERLLPD